MRNKTNVATSTNELHEDPKQCYPFESKGISDMITIRRFENAIVKHLNMTTPALDKRDRALKSAGLILSNTERKGAIPVTASDAAYVVLVAVSNAKLDDTVDAVRDLGALVCWNEKNPPEGFETLHSALTRASGPAPKPFVRKVVVRPHILEAEINLEVGPPGDTIAYTLKYKTPVPRTDLLPASMFDIQHEFVIKAEFFTTVQNLIEGPGEIVDEGPREGPSEFSEENERLALVRFLEFFGDEQRAKEELVKWRKQQNL